MTGPRRVQKRPIPILAYRYDGTNADDIARWVNGYTPQDEKAYVGLRGELVIDTLEGLHTAQPGDHVMRGVVGEFYPMRPDVFDASYDELGPA